VAEPPDLQPAAEPPRPGNIPWGYGTTRVTAMPVDPWWLFVYWELTDEAIAQARSALGGADGDCALRVHDTTYRLFDGTNANWHTDVAVHRPSNNHYVRVDSPGSTLHVDIGFRSHDGRFATIVRTAPVEMPRSAIAADTRAEWMTVTPATAPAAPYAHRFTPRHPAPAGPEAEAITRSLAGEGWSPVEWNETDAGGTVRWVRWFRGERWGALEPGLLSRVRIVFEGQRRILRMEQGERVVLGPWRVTIQGLDPHGGHRVIDRWEIHYAWATEAGTARVEMGPIWRRIVEGYRSRLLRSGSEERLGAEAWASEALQMGASEWPWLAGSEARLAGASEMLYLGASEVLGVGASERLAMGASEVLALGASEMQFLGASGLGGASELVLGGASRFPGASEALAGPEPPPDTGARR
jgi:hypothetical protein